MIKLGEIIELNKTHRQEAAIVLDKGLFNQNLVTAFTPTQASVKILKRLVQIVLPGVPPEQRTINCFGSYGSGKSHLGVLIGQLLRDGAHSPEFAIFLRKLEDFGEPELAKALQQVFLPPKTDPDARPYLLVPLYASQTPSLQVKLLEGLYKAIKTHPQLTLDSILPLTEYQAAYQRFQEIIQDVPDYQNADLSNWQLEGDYLTTEEMAIGLQHSQPLALKTFSLWHQRVCHGAKFRATDLEGKNVVEAYQEACENLANHFHYGGIAIIWDELGHALEDLMRTPERNAVEEIIELQRFVETNCSPDRGHLLFLGLTHVSLAEYGARSEAAQDVRDRLKTIEGRFTSLKVELKPSELEGYHLLGAQHSWTTKGQHHLADSKTVIDSLANVCAKLPLFQKLIQDLPQIIRDAYPLHPITAAALFAISTRYAQATRTAFTFFRDLNVQILERSINEKSLFKEELIRLPELIDYYGGQMEKEASGMMEMYHRAVAEVRAKGETSQSKVNILGVLLLSKILGEHFQSTEPFLAAALLDKTPHHVSPLQQDLLWLKNAGLIWKNQITELWSLAGEAWIDPESLIKEKRQSITLTETWALLTQYPEMREDLLPFLGKHDLEPSPCGIVRSYSVELLKSPFKISNPDNPSKAAQIFIIIAKDSQAAIEAQQICQSLSYRHIYYWIPRKGTHYLNDKLRRYVAIEELLKQKTHGEGLKRQFEARWEENRQALKHQMSELFGRQGLLSGQAQIFRAGDESKLTCTSWHNFRIFLTQAVHQQYKSEIYVCSMGFNHVDDETYTTHAKVIEIVHKILNFDHNTAYQNDLLGEKETSQTAGIIDGILGQYSNQLFIEREHGWDIKNIDETKGAIHDVLTLIRNELLRHREKPYKISELRKKLLKPPYGLPPSTYAILTAVALRKDIKRLTWVNQKTNEPFEKVLARAFAHNSTLEIRLQDFNKKQLIILRLLAEILNIPRQPETDENEYAKQAVQKLRQFIKDLPDSVKEAPKLDEKARQLAKFFRAVGKTAYHLADLLIQLTDLQTELKSDFGSINNYPQTRQQLTALIQAFEKIKNERFHALQKVFREQIPESINEREELIKQLHDLGTRQGLCLAQVIGKKAIDENVIDRLVQEFLDKNFDQCREIEIGELIGELKGLFENARRPKQAPPITQQPLPGSIAQQRPVYRVAESSSDLERLQLTNDLRKVITVYQSRLDKKSLLTAIQQVYTEIEKL
jgi:cell division protein FtsB